MTARRPLWIALVLVSAAAAIYASRNFARAFPIVTLDLKMTRETALREGRRVAGAEHLGPSEFREAVSFEEDEEAQSFVELEGGARSGSAERGPADDGKVLFNRLVREGPYFPYVWRVRHLQEGEINETTIRFTPSGQPYGFVEKIKEDLPGANLSPRAAQAIGERDAARAWHIRFGDYTLVEQGQETRPGGRRDHTFVYERPEHIGDGRFRLRIVVSGDRLTEVTHFLRIPEGFTRRYEKMRSANTAIGVGSLVAMVLLYFGAGCGLGLFVLLRQRFVLWRQAIACGALVALVQFLVTLNEWPLAWMHYDTAVSVQGFVAQRLTRAVAAFAALAILFSVSFMAAESLTRRAFPRHPQFWRIWTPRAAATPAIAGRTIAGYLLIPVFFAYEVFLYLYATRRLGWWAPSEALFHPDVLATYVPWLSAIAQSFQAGFWEESLFRAVPIAGAALIGERLGARRTFIVVAFVVQAVVFGSGHAPYPNQPAYARPVELLVPSVGFGLIYLWYGLLPGILLHFGFDLTFFALPLFVASAPGIWIQRAMILVLGLVPVWIVIAARWCRGRWDPLAQDLLNAAWRPAAVAPPPPTPVERPAAIAPEALSRMAPVLAGAAAALAAGLIVLARADRIPELEVRRQAAVEKARAALEAQRAQLGGRWKLMTDVVGTPGLEHRFVRQTAGKDTYATLLGRYLSPPGWQIRDVTFEGDVAERAEEWDVFVGPDGAIRRVRHALPESRSAPGLDEPAARALARATASNRFHVADASLRDVSAVPEKLPGRVDWRFTFEDTTTHLPEGQARIRIAIAGHEVADAFQFVHVPEAASRAERSREVILGVVRLAGTVPIVLVAMAGAVAAIVVWSGARTRSGEAGPARGRFDAGFGWRVALLVAIAAAAGIANDWPRRETQFMTAAPYQLQVLLVAAVSAVITVVEAGASGLLAGLTARWSAQSRAFSGRAVAALGAALGLAMLAISLGLDALPGARAAAVRWPDYGPAATVVPAAAVVLSAIVQFVFATTVLLFVFGATNAATSGWRRRQARWLVAVAVLGLAVAAARAIPLGGMGITAAAVVVKGVLYAVLAIAASRWILCFDLRPIPIAVAVLFLAEDAQGVWARAFPGAVPAYVIAALAAIALAWWWTALKDEQ